MSSPLAANMVLSSGKAINDLGDFDLCQTTPGLKYGTFILRIGDLGYAFMGVCLPETCTTPELQIVLDAMVTGSGGLVTTARFNFTDEVEVEMTAARAVGITFFVLLVAVCIFGAVVEYTSLFGHSHAGEVKPEDDAAKHKTLVGKIFISFSPARNMRKLFYAPFNSSDNLNVLNGVRVLSMMYVILGHAYFNVLLIPTSNTWYAPHIMQPLWFQVIPGGFYAVDVFFYLSAFLGIYLMLEKFSKTKRMNFPLIYFHRFYRLAPNVFLVIMFFTTFYAYFGNGPIWIENSKFWIKDCPKNWWTYVLFINSIYPGDNSQCAGWLWYLSHDMLFFLLLPFQVFTYLKNRRLGYLLSAFILIANLAIVLGLTIGFNIGPSVFTDPQHGSKLYFRPWARFGAYQVGIFLGMFYYEYVKGEKVDGDKSTFGFSFYKTVRLNFIVRYFCYLFGFALIMLAVFLPTPETRSMPNRHFGKVFSAFFNPLSRPAYVFGLGLILAGPLAGRGRFLKVFLGSRFWAPWAKLSFYAYLIHMFVFSFYFGQMRTSLYLNHKTILFSYCGVILLTLLMAIPFSVFLEAPWMQLEKLVLFPPRRKNNPVSTKYENLKINNSDMGNSTFAEDPDTADNSR